MYLKSIEVQGFKSFANKIVFEFHNGITGIVGPNGSGKSNVADAVRWVLGEQRAKQLRGGSMQDVIFSGTENRKPLSYASVAITLDNSDHQLAIDFNEVTVTRKIYRSGESEYLINGSLCRLKDVNELFYDTGIGKEGYSIIGQGQIDKILSGKPEERRELFDEAAGIVKFKRRKSMSLKKLADEKQNLVRITDILSELEKQIGPLEKQSEIAKEYLKKKEELKKYDIHLFLLESEQLRNQISGLEEHFELAQTELQTSTEAYEYTKAEYSRIEDELDTLDHSIEKTKNQLNETHLLKQQLEGQIDLLQEQIHSAQKSDEHYAQRSDRILQEMKARQSQQETYVTDLQSIKKNLQESQQQVDHSQENLVHVQENIVRLSAELEDAKQQIIELLNRRASTKAKMQHYNTMLEQMQIRKSAMNQKLIQISSAVSVQEQEISKHTNELQQITDEIQSHLHTIQSDEEQIKHIQEELTAQAEQLRVGQTTYHRESSRLESLKNMTERYDGYGNSIRKVMEQKEKVTGILGVVADLVKVEKEYEIAIETALGGSIQNIVTDHEDTAKKMIQFLKQNKFGRATFLPLTSITGGQGLRQSEALQEHGVIGLASTLVSVEERFRKLADHLLGRTIVVRHIDDGIALARKYKQSLRIVTLEGELMNPGGSMTGGSFKNTSNLLSRRREIEELECKIKQFQQNLVTLQNEMDAKKRTRADYYAKIDQEKELLQRAYVVQNTIKMNLNQSEAKKKEAADSVLALRKEGSDLSKQFSEIHLNQDSIQMELETSEQCERDLNVQIASLEKQLEEERQNETNVMQFAEQIRLQFANYEQQYQFAEENHQRICEELAKFEEELKSLAQSKQDSSLEIVNKEKQIQNIHETIAHSKEVFTEIEEQLSSLHAEKDSLTKKNKDFLQQRESLATRMADLDKECFRLTSKMETLQETLDKQIDYMWNEYEITLRIAKEMQDDTMTDLPWLKKAIQTLKSEIKGLGNVNVNAIEDFKHVSERYTFLQQQHEDLVEAEAALQQIIEELDSAMRKQFAERFSEIASEFDNVFKQLFGGGKGTLELMDDEDILEAGIRIIAQPPGKKLQNMMQLSGGEKALTAIALLFAIQNLKPSPFCLLDEIEAALDDSNVDRYAKYLHKLTKHTQFIVITHRRGTMNAADRLYGITMQEKGVSTLVSVDLLEKEITT